MPQFLAMTSRGLGDVLQAELDALGMKKTQKVQGGVLFESNWAGCYLVNFCSRVATRVVLPILDFPAYQPEDLYHNVLKHDFTKYIWPAQKIAVDASIREGGGKWRDQRFVALKVKDAIVDQFRNKFQIRPSVDKDQPDLRVLVRVVENSFSLAIDTSGDNLSQRGYREKAVEAPLREHLAAGLIEITGWDRQSPIVDPMCGSGTFLIEAALMALQRPPQYRRKKFAFQGFQNFKPEVWNEVKKQVLENEKSNLDFKFYGFDISDVAIETARENARMAGVEKLIEFKVAGIDRCKPPVDKGTLIVNPPYGERLGEVERLKKIYGIMGDTFRKNFRSWHCFVLSGSEELTPYLKLKSSRKFQVFNGNIECRFLDYEIRSSKPETEELDQLTQEGLKTAEETAPKPKRRIPIKDKRTH